MDAISFRNSRGSTHPPAPTRPAVLALAIVFTFAIGAVPTTQAQTYTVLHFFTGQGDGAHPSTGLTIDAAGNLYGTTSIGGPGLYGTVFRLKHSGSGWTLNTLYGFGDGRDGGQPEGRVVLAKDGTLYGTTVQGGSEYGVVFHLTPPPTAPRSALTPWNETVIYQFTGRTDGGNPQGDLTFDQAGNIYGTTPQGGAQECHQDGSVGCGTVYEITPSGSGWVETVLYAPQEGSDGAQPVDGVVFDASGNLYGEFQSGGPFNWGLIYQLSPSESGWTEHPLFDFTGGNNGGVPEAGMIFDPSSGNLYGTTNFGGSGGCGTVFQLTPVGGGWLLNTIYGFTGSPGGCNPEAKLVRDAAGNLYGTTTYGGNRIGQGTVFKLTHGNGGWTATTLHAFTGGDDGAYPMSSLVFDAAGNLYGTTYSGGDRYDGVVFELTP